MSEATKRRMPLQSRMRFGFNAGMILLFAYTTYEAWGFRSLARYLPFSISLLALVVMVIGLFIDIVAYRRSGVVAADDVPVTAALAGSEIKEHKLSTGKGAMSADGDGRSLEPVDSTGTPIDPADVPLDPDRVGEIEGPGEVLKRSGIVFLWILGFLVSIAVVGLTLASAGFLMGYLFLQARTGWKVPVIGTVAILTLMFVMREALNLEWPPYLLEETFAGWFGFE